MDDFAYVRGCEADLVAIGGISGSRLAGNDFLREFAGQGLRNRFPDVARTRDAHGLIDIAAAAERVADGAAQAGGCTAEGLDFRRMVMGFVLEHQEPFFHDSVVVHVYVDAAGVVFFADLHVVQQAFGLEVTGAHGGQVHQADVLVGAAQFLADLGIHLQGAVDVFFDEGFIYVDALELCCKGRMAAMVAPVRVQDAQFRFVRIAAFLPEILHHLCQVVCIHRQSVLPAEGCQFR